MKGSQLIKPLGGVLNVASICSSIAATKAGSNAVLMKMRPDSFPAVTRSKKNWFSPFLYKM
jgi:hypothetical protein